jgi:SOS response regulatory protein OraA/RecX
VDGRCWRTVPDEVVLRAGLIAGLVLERPVLRRLRSELRRVEALALAGHAIERHDLSRGRLDARLTRAGLTAAEREQVLATLERSGLVDDSRLARARAEVLAERGWGAAAFAARLVAEGVGPEIAREAIADLAVEAERASALVEGGADRGRTASYLVRHGFDEDSIEAALGSLDETDRPGLR